VIEYTLSEAKLALRLQGHELDAYHRDLFAWLIRRVERMQADVDAADQQAAAALERQYKAEERVRELEANRGPGNIQEVLDVAQHDLRRAEGRCCFAGVARACPIHEGGGYGG
jgi:hypothetical protein